MRTNILNKKIEYIRNTFIKEDNILLDIKNEAKLLNREINIAPEDGQLLQIFIKLKNIKNILEIGTFMGYSTIWLARGLNEEGKITTIEKDLNIYNKAIDNFKKANLLYKINCINDTAQNFLKNTNEKFDMIFIDADKSLYLDFLDLSEKHLKNNGLIIADNTLLSSAVYTKDLPYRIRQTTKDNMIEFNKKLANSKNYLSILIQNEDGLTIAIKK